MSESQPVSQRQDEQAEWDEGEGDYEEDDDIDAEAEAIARRLGAELWADIKKAKAEGSASTNATLSQAPSTKSQNGTGLHPTTRTTNVRKEDEALNTVRGILKFVSTDPLLRTVLSSSPVKPGNETVLAALENMASTGTISNDLAMPLSIALVELAKSEALFGCLRLSDAPAVQLANGKRKRDGPDDGRQQQIDARPPKRPYMDTDLRSRIEEAVRVIAQTLGRTPAQVTDPSIISSIRLQLHQVFLFAVTSSVGGGHGVHALQEVGGLIQVIGVLSGIQIGQPSENIEGHEPHPYGANPSYPWFHGHTPSGTTNIGTAVYPCLIAGCGKTFSRLYSLRGHQRLHSVHRPFRCNLCPASFARNHDLKRHLKLHSNKAWKCAGCSKVFSRRDAIKRHKDGCKKTRGPKGEACINAEVLEVELEEEGDETSREERRAKIWSGITVNQISGKSTTTNQDEVEEGEIPLSVISSAQTSVLSLHAILQAQVESALGTSVGQSTSPSVDVTAGQATLASVIARAQSQTLPPEAIGVRASSQSATSDQSAEHCHVEPPEIGDSRAGDEPPGPLPFSMYGLSDEQTRLLEEAIANAALAAQAQAEAEAALEEQEEADEDYDEEDEDGFYSKGQPQADKIINELGD